MKLKKILALAVGAAMLTSAIAVSAGTYPVDLPEGALLSSLYVNSEPRTGNYDSGNNPAPGLYTWQYQLEMRSFAEGTAEPQFFLYGDRAFATNNAAERGGDGLYNFLIRSMPEFLEGAHFLQLANDARNPGHASVTDENAAHIVFTAAVDLYAFLGVDMRINPAAYIVADHIPNSEWEFMGPEYFIENNETDALAGNRNPNFFDPDHVYDEFGPVRFYLHRMFVAAGETVAIPTPGEGNPMLALAFTAAGEGANETVAPPADDVVEDDVIEDDGADDATPAPTAPPVNDDATPAPTAAPTDNDDDDGGLSTALIIALVAGGAVLLLIIIFFVVKKK